MSWSGCGVTRLRPPGGAPYLAVGPAALCVPPVARGRRPPVSVGGADHESGVVTSCGLVASSTSDRPDCAGGGPCRSWVGGGADAGVSAGGGCAVVDGGSAVPGCWWAVVPVISTGSGSEGVEHPAWCARERCGHVVPPLFAHMVRRHRSRLWQAGTPGVAGGGVVAYLIGGDRLPPVVAVHAAAPQMGSGCAELRLTEVRKLVDALGELLAQADTAPDAGNDGDNGGGRGGVIGS